MVTVHRFRVWDHVRAASVAPPHKGTAEHIKRIGGRIIEGTAEEADPDKIDAEGRFVRDAPSARSA